MDVDSHRMHFIRTTIGLHTATLGLIPGSWKYHATLFFQQMER